VDADSANGGWPERVGGRGGGVPLNDGYFLPTLGRANGCFLASGAFDVRRAEMKKTAPNDDEIVMTVSGTAVNVESHE
jgi:hypothetical protein